MNDDIAHQVAFGFWRGLNEITQIDAVMEEGTACVVLTAHTANPDRVFTTSLPIPSDPAAWREHLVGEVV